MAARIPHLVRQLSTTDGGGGDDRVLVQQRTLMEILRNFYPVETERQCAAALHESGGVPAVVAVLRNFGYHDEDGIDIVWSVCRVLVFATNSSSDPEATIRRALVESGGVATLLDVLGRQNQEENPFLFQRIFQATLCIVSWINDVPRLRVVLAPACSGHQSATNRDDDCGTGRGSLVEKVLFCAQRTVENEASTANAAILLATLANQPQTIGAISSNVTPACLEALLDILYYWQATEDIVFCLIRFLCSLLMDNNGNEQRRRSRVHKTVADCSTNIPLAEAILDVCSLYHLDSRRVQTQTLTLMELLTEQRADYGHEINVPDTTQFVVRAMARYPNWRTLQRSGIRVMTNLLREQQQQQQRQRQQQKQQDDGSADVRSILSRSDDDADDDARSDQVRRVVRRARRLHRGDIIIKARHNYYFLLSALLQGSRRKIWIETIRSPILAISCVREQELERKVI